MNSHKVRYSCFVVCLSVLLGSSWTAPAVAGSVADLRLAAGPISGGGVGSTKPATSVPVKPLPAGSPLAAPKTSQPPQVAAQTIEPAWPQPFELGPGEQTGFGFVAGNPGPIVVNVRWTGVPLTVILAKPGGFFIYQQGNGSVTLQYNATADDVKNGVLWGVSLHPTQVAAKPPVGSRITVIEKPVKIDTRGLAKGTVSVQHPPGDMKLAQAELKARADRLALQAKSKPVATANVNVLAQKQAALQKQQTVRQAALLEQVRSKIPVQAYQQTSQRIAFGAKPGAVSSQSSAMTAATGIPLGQKSGVAVKVTDTPVQPLVSNAGSNAPATTVPADPLIRLVEHSLSTGQPGDPVLLAGSGFSNNPGEVHFIVANGKDVAAPVTFWSDTQIMVTVPDVPVALAFDGQVYVQRGASRSNSLAFRFEPVIEFRTIFPAVQYVSKEVPTYTSHGNYSTRIQVYPHPMVGDFSNSTWSSWSKNVMEDGNARKTNDNGYEMRGTLFDWNGHRGDDDYFPGRVLMNGWIADSAYLANEWNNGPIEVSGFGGDAYISAFTPGTSSPRLTVHYWYDGFSTVDYTPYVVIKGPRGMPYQ